MSAQELIPSPNARVIESAAGPVWLEDDGVLREVLTVSSVEKTHVETLYGALLELGGSAGEWRIIADLRRVRWISAAAREFGSGPALAQLVRANAFLVGSPVTRVIASFFVRVSHPPFAVRLFDAIPPALDWLGEQQERTGTR